MEVKLEDSATIKTDMGDETFWRVDVTNDASPWLETDIKATTGASGYISQQYLGTRIDY